MKHLGLVLALAAAAQAGPLEYHFAEEKTAIVAKERQLKAELVQTGEGYADFAFTRDSNKDGVYDQKDETFKVRLQENKPEHISGHPMMFTYSKEGPTLSVGRCLGRVPPFGEVVDFTLHHLNRLETILMKNHEKPLQGISTYETPDAVYAIDHKRRVILLTEGERSVLLKGETFDYHEGVRFDENLDTTEGGLMAGAGPDILKQRDDILRLVGSYGLR